MATFIKVDERVAAVAVVSVVLVGWMVLYPDSFSSTIDSAVSMLQGAWDGAMGAR